MKHTNMYVGPYEATHMFKAELSEKEEARIERELLKYMLWLKPAFPDLTYFVEDDMKYGIPAVTSDFDGLMTSITFRFAANDYNRPI